MAIEYRFHPDEFGYEGEWEVVVDRVLVADGETVPAGRPVLVVTCTKSTLELHAPTAGTVRVLVAEGDRVTADTPLIAVEPTEATAQPTAGFVWWKPPPPRVLTADEQRVAVIRGYADLFRDGRPGLLWMSEFGCYPESVRVQRVASGLWWDGRQDVLAPAQAEAITALGEWLFDAVTCTNRLVAPHLDTLPADYEAFLKRHVERQHAAVRHAEQAVALGLLTPAQADAVTRAWLVADQTGSLFWDEDKRNLLGVTDAQADAASRLGREANDILNQFDWKTSDRDEQRRLNEAIPVVRGRTDAALFALLTPEQRARWEELTAERPLPPAPDLSAPTADEAARVDLYGRSPVFRALAGRPHEFGLTDAQRELVSRLATVVRTGLHWIGLRGQAAAGEQFLRHAEHVARLGVLTEAQAARAEPGPHAPAGPPGG